MFRTNSRKPKHNSGNTGNKSITLCSAITGKQSNSQVTAEPTAEPASKVPKFTNLTICAGDTYQNEQSQVDLPPTARNLLDPMRLKPFASSEFNAWQLLFAFCEKHCGKLKEDKNKAQRRKHIEVFES